MVLVDSVDSVEWVSPVGSGELNAPSKVGDKVSSLIGDTLRLAIVSRVPSMGLVGADADLAFLNRAWCCC